MFHLNTLPYFFALIQSEFKKSSFKLSWQIVSPIFTYLCRRSPKSTLLCFKDILHSLTTNSGMETKHGLQSATTKASCAFFSPKKSRKKR